MKKAKWFLDLEKTRKEFNNIGNCIEVFKFKYERENHIYEWVIGVSLALLFSLGIADVLRSQNRIFLFLGIFFYMLSLLALFISVALHFLANNRQKKFMIYLYRKKDKEENKNKSKKE